MTKRGWLVLLGAVAVALVAGSVALPGSNQDGPSVFWSPRALNEEVLAGQSLTILVRFTAREALRNVTVRVVPELEEVVSVKPAALGDIAKDSSVELEVTIAPPVTLEPQTLEGTTQLRSDLRPPRAYSPPLSTRVAIAWPVASLDGVSLVYPPSLARSEDQDHVSLGTLSDDGLPPKVTVFVFDVPTEIAALPSEEALHRLPALRLEDGDVLSSSLHDGGIEVVARTFANYHFFMYDPASLKGVQFMSGQDGFFSTELFVDLAHSLQFPSEQEDQ